MPTVRRLLGLSLLLLTSLASAEEPPPTPQILTHWYDEVAVHGLVSFTASAAFNNPAATDDLPRGRNLYRAFDFMANSLTLDVAEITVERLPQSPHDIGLRIDFGAGETEPPAGGANGSHVGPFDLIQAYLYFTLADGLRLDLGKFISPVGYESFERYDAVSDNYSHGFQFFFNPFTHTGVKVSYATKIVTVAGYVIEGADVLVDNNRALSFGALVSVTPNDLVTAQIVYFGGKEQAGDDPPFRHLLDVVVGLKPAANVTAGANLSFGTEADQSWFGAAGYVGWGFLKDYSLALRGEVYADPDGNKTGVAGGQTLIGLTGDLLYRFGTHHLFRAEARWDHSSKSVFPTHDGTSPSQVTLAANYVGLF